MRVAIFAAAMMVAMAGAAFAGPLEDAYADLQRGDYPAAAKIYRQFAEQGDVRAQNDLGALYDRGLGVPKDFAEAVKWYRLAAEKDYAPAQGNLAASYFNGRGVPQDDEEAMKWGLRAAEQNNALGQLVVGAMYALGRGVPVDRVLAYKYFNLSAAQTNSGVAADAIKARDDLASKMTPEQIAEAQKLSREWQPKPE